MISAHTHTNAAPGAPARSALVRLARSGVLACALAWLGLGAAQAQHGRGAYRDEAQMQQAPRERYPQPQRDEGARAEQRYEPRPFDSREFDDVRRQRQQQMQQEQNLRNAEGGRRTRMTPDERRDLRRQINEAGMDLYPPNRPRR